MPTPDKKSILPNQYYVRDGQDTRWRTMGIVVDANDMQTEMVIYEDAVRTDASIPLVRKEKEFRKLFSPTNCNCECHKPGANILHFMACCEYR
jgi:hypothetical protein